MKRTLVGIGLLVAAGVGSVAMAPGGAAQDQGDNYEFLEAEIVPNPADPGEEVTFSSIDPCTFDLDYDGTPAKAGDVVIYELDAQGEIIREIDTVDMADDGHWTYTFNAEEQPGTYIYGAECRNEIFNEEVEKCLGEDDHGQEGFQAENISYSAPMWPVDCKFQVAYVELTVGGDEVPPTTGPPTTEPETETPPPATPVVTPPDFTG